MITTMMMIIMTVMVIVMAMIQCMTVLHWYNLLNYFLFQGNCVWKTCNSNTACQRMCVSIQQVKNNVQLNIGFLFLYQRQWRAEGSAAGAQRPRKSSLGASNDPVF